jgi:DNA-binding PadR family transcriptional regulator
VAGVQLLDEMCRRGWLEHNEPEENPRSLYHLTPQGTQALRERGVDVVRACKARRRFAFGCVDWTERRAHLGGALGSVILEAMLRAGIVQRQQQSRAVVFQKSVGDWLDAPSP